jgi:hypothetical protein
MSFVMELEDLLEGLIVLLPARRQPCVDRTVATTIGDSFARVDYTGSMDAAYASAIAALAGSMMAG